MVKKKTDASLSSIGSYSHSSQDRDLEGFVVDDDAASDVKLRFVDAMRFRRGILLGEVKRDISRKVNEDLFDEQEYQKRMAKADIADRKRIIPAYKPKGGRKKTAFIASIDRSESLSPGSYNRDAQSLSANLMRLKPLSFNSVSRAKSAPSRYRQPKNIKNIGKEEKEVRKHVVALFNADRQVFQNGKKKGVLGIEDPLGMLIAATGCLPENMFNKGLDSEDQEDLNAHSNMVAKLILGGDKDPQLKWLIFMNRDQLKIIISHIYSEHLWSMPETARNAEKRELRERWLAFLLYLVSRCLDIHYEEFVTTILDMFDENVKLGISELMETFNENPFGLQYYVCSYYASKSERYMTSSDRRKSVSRKAKQLIRKPKSSARRRAHLKADNIVSGKRRRTSAQSKKSNALGDLIAHRRWAKRRPISASQ